MHIGDEDKIVIIRWITSENMVSGRYLEMSYCLIFEDNEKKLRVLLVVENIYKILYFSELLKKNYQISALYCKRETKKTIDFMISCLGKDKKAKCNQSLEQIHGLWGDRNTSRNLLPEGLGCSAPLDVDIRECTLLCEVFLEKVPVNEDTIIPNTTKLDYS
uniref:Uncharacterized protein n=1 Tax=Strigamia maritima TaxID=126957 RepID=T1JLJ4_STRMM